MSSAMLGLPARLHRREHPFWHRPAPAVSVVRLDPGFAAVRAQLPEGWEPLVRVKYLLDALTTVARRPGRAPSDDDGRSQPLFDALARDLEEVARRAPGRVLPRQMAAAGDATRAYASTGRWPVLDLEPPRPGELWMYFGPLRPWAMQEAPEPLALLVGRPELVAQRAVDRVTSHRVRLQEAVARVLGRAVHLARALPEMLAVDLLLAGGTADSGHKNFAHFFPLESPVGRASQGDFTVVFSNVHVERLARCSLRLLAEVGGGSIEIEPGDLVRASLAWFRSHDLAHFWTTEPLVPPGGAVSRPDVSTSDVPRSFEEMVLHEALADTLGLLSLADLEDPAALGTAFAAEMLRYLSRNHHEFADTTAAALEVGWLAREVDLPWAEPRRWLEAALPSFGGLARALLAALEGSPGPLADLRSSLDGGRQLVARWYGPLAAVPTDLEYSFG